MDIDPSRAGLAVAVLGVLLTIGGIVYALGGRLPLGRLPGDISGGSSNLRWSIPLGSSLAISVVGSIVLTVVLTLIVRR